ncbi:MAG: DUF4832 domain-containing protein [Dermatophilaceae bacterium]
MTIGKNAVATLTLTAVLAGSTASQAYAVPDPGEPITGTVSVAPLAAVADPITTTYTADSGDILNPERGFEDVRWISNDPQHKAGTNFTKVRANGYTLSRTQIGLNEFRDGPISEARLNEIRTGWGNARAAGVKVVPIFSYCFPLNGAKCDLSNISVNDIKSHLEQLKPIFAEYADVIATFQSGFLGPWGEWHSNPINSDPVQEQAAYDALLDAVPASRMFQVRYVRHLKELTPAKVSAETAYNGSVESRTGLGNMCFLADQVDAGTYTPKDDTEANKQYLEDVSQFTVVGGEACSHNVGLTTARDDCQTAQAELDRFHWSFMNPYSGTNSAVERWKSEGCLDTITKRLGYRLELTTSTVQGTAAPGQTLSASFTVKNTGYAAPFNPRGLQLVLRNQSTGDRFPMDILQEGSDTLDPRKWYTEAGEIVVDAAPTVPAGTPAGTYDLLLGLPDPAGDLGNRPEYSIRTANQNTWDAATGLNLLTRGVKIG